MEDVYWGKSQGVRIIMIEELMDRGINDVMAEARQIAGDQPTYVSFDIDGIDPSMARVPAPQKLAASRRWMHNG